MKSQAKSQQWLSGFQDFLEGQRLVSPKRKPYYVNWVVQFLRFIDDSGDPLACREKVRPFLREMAKSREDWQVKQASDAVRLFLYYLSREKGDRLVFGSNCETKWKQTESRLIEVLRLKHRSIRTEKSYLQWLWSLFS